MLANVRMYMISMLHDIRIPSAGAHHFKPLTPPQQATQQPRPLLPASAPIATAAPAAAPASYAASFAARKQQQQQPQQLSPFKRAPATSAPTGTASSSRGNTPPNRKGTGAARPAPATEANELNGTGTVGAGPGGSALAQPGFYKPGSAVGDAGPRRAGAATGVVSLGGCRGRAWHSSGGDLDTPVRRSGSNVSSSSGSSQG
eukprot:1145311-Pelagomonas_calceolata.AAC.1